MMREIAWIAAVEEILTVSELDRNTTLSAVLRQKWDDA
jgi:hypothetical protein